MLYAENEIPDKIRYDHNLFLERKKIGFDPKK
jgi:hypothetical protein